MKPAAAVRAVTPMADGDRINVVELSRDRAAVMQALNLNPEFVKARADGLRELYADPDYSKEHAARSRDRICKLNADQAFRDKQRTAASAFQKRRWEQWRAEKAGERDRS